MGKPKRKKSLSPIPSNAAKKQLRDNASVVSDSVSSCSISLATQVAQAPQTATGKPVKPIFADSSLQNIRKVIAGCKLKTPPVFKIKYNGSTQILCFNTDDKHCVTEKLKALGIGYHTFSEPSEKSPSYILKGFYHTTTDEILNILTSSGLSVKKVSYFIKKGDFVMYLIQFSSTTNVNVLNHSYRYLDGVVVKWETLRKSNGQITQCFNCQRWGHSSINCGLSPRCVKCSENHPKGLCARTSAVIGEPTCCNCGGNHSSNYRDCPAYKEHLKRVQSRRRPAQVVPVSNFNLCDNQFPSLSQTPAPGPLAANHVSFSRIVKESNDSIFDKLSKAQAKFKSIPLIHETLNHFIAMVDELSLSNDIKDRCMIITKYCLTSDTSNHDF